LIYSATKKIDLWVGGELVGGAFRTDRNDNIKPAKLNGTTVNFSDYRAAVGFVYTVSDAFKVNFDAGCSIQRQFDFGRAGETYRTDPSPYVRILLCAQFLVQFPGLPGGSFLPGWPAPPPASCGSSRRRPIPRRTARRTTLAFAI